MNCRRTKENALDAWHQLITYLCAKVSVVNVVRVFHQDRIINAVIQIENIIAGKSYYLALAAISRKSWLTCDPNRV